MVAPVKLHPKRRYTKVQKVTAVMAAEMSNVSAAAEQTGVPRTTLMRWMEDPEMVEMRQKTRGDRAAAANVMSLVVLGEIRRRLPEFEPRDLIPLYGVLTDKGQLLDGAATSRNETVTNGFDDHEREALREVLDSILHPVKA